MYITVLNRTYAKMFDYSIHNVYIHRNREIQSSFIKHNLIKLQNPVNLSLTIVKISFIRLLFSVFYSN